MAKRVLLWRCYKGQRVAMVQPCDPHSCRGYELHRGACGAPLPIETEVDAFEIKRRAERRANEAAQDSGLDLQDDGPLRHAMPQGQGWR